MNAECITHNAEWIHFCILHSDFCIKSYARVCVYSFESRWSPDDGDNGGGYARGGDRADVAAGAAPGEHRRGEGSRGGEEGQAGCRVARGEGVAEVGGGVHA